MWHDFFMAITKLVVQRDYLDRLIKTPPLAVEELIWNAIDADADIIQCNITKSAAGAPESLVITDNGEGFTKERAELAFGKLGGSWKAMAAGTEGGRSLHGKAGQGRLAAFGIGEWVKWTTTSESVEGDGLRTHQITGHKATFQEMEIEEIQPPLTGKGASVEVGNLNKSAIKWLDSSKPVDRLTSTYALTIEKYGIDMRWENKRIDPAEIQSSRWTESLSVEGLGDEHEPIDLVVIEWKIPEGRKLLLCDSKGLPIHETNVGIHAPGFNFTAYVRWDGFTEHAANLLLGDLAPEPVKAVLAVARDRMKTYFAERVRNRGSELVQKWKDDNIYPYKENPKTQVEKAERELFEIVAVTAADAFKDTETKSRKLSLHLIKEALENNPSGLQEVLTEVIGLDDDDLADLGSLLKETTLSSIIRSTREIADRLKFIAGLEEIIYGSEIRKTILERTQLHRILAAETWIFREEYQLTADDTTLKTALEKYQNLLASSDVSSDEIREREVLDYNGGNPVVDLMLSRVVEQRENRRHHIVIEIKRPTVHIGHTQIGQIERYAAAVVDDGRFNLSTTSWEFWIVGDKIAPAAKMKTARNGVIQEPTTEYPVTIRAVSWAQIIQDARHRLKFVQEGLAFGTTNEQAMEHLREKHGSFLPGVIQEDVIDPEVVAVDEEEKSHAI